ncbi:hypothetical protein ACFZBU_34265 [Embleya sp. NPDC008237]|uniref:hypothetical protein n=1 Tax=Embleya sp. NPDC008237 TaxID=3363978 RepID=UPI0036EB59E8
MTPDRASGVVEDGRPAARSGTIHRSEDFVTVITDFRSMLRDVAPHMGTDDTLPAWFGIRVEADDRHVHLIATDRYTLAVARRAAPRIGTWTARLTPTDVKALDALCRISRTHNVELAHDGTRPTVRVDTHTLILDNPDTDHDAFPNWKPLVRKALAAASAPTREVAVNARYLARWGRALSRSESSEPALITTAEPGGPLVVARGLDFIGLQMPVKVNVPDTDRSPMDKIRDAWTWTLDGTAPPTGDCHACPGTHLSEVEPDVWVCTAFHSVLAA